MKLKLNRPIAFIDLEATGVDREEDRIVEIAICKLFPDGSMETKTRRVNPTIPIPPEATEIHGISDDDVKDEPTFSKIAKGILDHIEGCDIGGFNSNTYDIPLLFNEFQRCGIYWDYTKFKMVDVGNIYKINEPRTLSAGVSYYLNENHEDSHSAEADIEATARVFLAQVDKYEELPHTIEDLHLYSNYGKEIMDLSGKFVKNEEGVVLLNFGKYKGEPAAAHLDFLEWMVYKANFPQDTVKVANNILGNQLV